MKSIELKYIMGEDRHSLEVFEPLWQKVLSEFVPQSKIALILPCTWGKPYLQSFIMQRFFQSLLVSTSVLIQTAELKEEKVLLPYGDILNHIDVWHMSSCGYVPMSMQHDFDEESKLGFFAYDWDSSRASDQDIKDWYDVADRRTNQWLEVFGSKYENVILYLRQDSKSRRVWRRFESSTKGKVFDCYFPTTREYSEPFLTLGGRITDPDSPILNPERVTYLAMMLVSAYRKLKES